MYANDTTLVSTLEVFGDRRYPENIQRNINSELAKIYEWLSLNYLNLNVNKSKFIVFHKHPKVIPVLKIQINNVEIDRVSEFNFFGVIVDEHITWKPHIAKIRFNISRIIGIMRKLQCTLPCCCQPTPPCLLGGVRFCCFMGVCRQLVTPVI